ncbi:hypothetical protein ZWY2020_038633 [Hordeum vulgare]|nr:hypothetical protein ZWY2020_038633 [Hordeum vulgare]
MSTPASSLLRQADPAQRPRDSRSVAVPSLAIEQAAAFLRSHAVTLRAADGVNATSSMVVGRALEAEPPIIYLDDTPTVPSNSAAALTGGVRQDSDGFRPLVSEKPEWLAPAPAKREGLDGFGQEASTGEEDGQVEGELALWSILNQLDVEPSICTPICATLRPVWWRKYLPEMQDGADMEAEERMGDLADEITYTMVKAVAMLTGSEGVKGTIFFTQEGDGPTTVTGSVTGLKEGLHGFHVHALGDTTNGCMSTGPHFNPVGHVHGAPEDEIRHAGDLGNVTPGADASPMLYFLAPCVANINVTDCHIPLAGPHSIIGHAVVVHGDADDLGKGNTLETLESYIFVPPCA